MKFLDLDAQRHALNGAIERAIARVVEHGRFVMGPEVGEFECALAGLTGASQVVGCASGTDALVMALMALDIGPGDAVVVPNYSFISTAEAVVLVGATPVFTNVGERDYCLVPDDIPTACRLARGAGLAPKAVIPVDLYGQPADYDAIARHASAEGLVVIADAAQSLGGALGGRQVGTLADVTTTSFFPSKTLGCYGDGGAVFTDDEALADRLRSIRVHGQGEDQYDNVRVGINGRLDTIQAAILAEKLAVFPREIDRRREIAARYSASLPEWCEVPAERDGVRSAWGVYTVRVPARDALAEHLKAAGVPTAVYYRRFLHWQGAYTEYPRVEMSDAALERVADSVLALPIHPYLTDAMVDEVVAAASTFEPDHAGRSATG